MSPTESNQAADAWLADEVRSEAEFERTGRYLQLVVGSLIGGFVLVAPPLIASTRADIGPAGAAVGVGAGALLLSATVTAMVVRDPYQAERWSKNIGALGLAALGTAFAVSSVEAGTFLPEVTGREDSGMRPKTLSVAYALTLTIGLAAFGRALSELVVDLALPMPSALELQTQVASLTPDQRYDRVRAYLARRDERRAWSAYTGTAATFLIGGLTWSIAQQLAVQEVRTAASTVGSAIIVSGLLQMISYWISSSEVARFDAGETPS